MRCNPGKLLRADEKTCEVKWAPEPEHPRSNRHVRRRDLCASRGTGDGVGLQVRARVAKEEVISDN